MANVIAIDIGTCYSSVGIYQNGKIKIIGEGKDNRVIPSFVSIIGRDILVGHDAKTQAASNLGNTFYDFKRLVGQKIDDPFIQTNKKYWPFEINEENGELKIQVHGSNQSFTPEELISIIIIKLKETAENFLGHPIAEAVLTIPAGFHHFQRQAIFNAGISAGFQNIRLINDSTASAIAYGMGNDHNIEDEQNVLIVNVGGGFVDVSIITIENGIFEVKSVEGAIHIGGEDFTTRMVNHFIVEFKRKYQKDLTSNQQALRRLRKACEDAKITLSNSSHAKIRLPHLFDGIDFCTSITNGQFKNLCADLFRNVINTVEKALRRARMDQAQIHEIFLAGGSSHIPKIQKLLSEFFGGKKLNKSLNANEATIHGASLYAACVSGLKFTKFQNFLLLDVAPLCLGVETAGGVMTAIISRNSTIPTKTSQTFTTNAGNQTHAIIKVYEGERAMVQNNILLAILELNEIPPAPKGVPSIEITFDVDSRGIIKVTAQDRESERSASTTISDIPNQVLERHGKENMKAKNEIACKKAVTKSSH